MPTHFGQFELNEQTRELRLNGKPVTLQPRVFDVLEYLVRHRNRVVGKEELLNTLWPDVIVTDASLQRAISLIRAALRPGGLADAVQTRARLGYRFSLEEPAPDAPAPEPGPPAAGADRGFPLLEREASLDELGRRLRLALTGKGQAVFIGGEAGIGKSSLVGAFLAGVPAEVTILRGYCDALFTPRAFGAILDVAAQLAARTDLPREQEFGELHRRLQALERGTILVLEDLHWADEATLDFLRFLVRRIGPTHCLLVATYRDDEQGSNRLLNQVLGDLGEPHVGRQRLLPLTAAAVARLASEAGKESGRILDLTGGNPFLLRELLSSPGSGVPETVRDSMVARLARCSPLARKTCEVVALVPGRAELDLINQLLADAGEAVDEATARGIIWHEGGTLSYRHELARLAVENLVAPAQARAWHAQILAALRARQADVARLVHHARCAGDRAAVLELAPEAARRAAAVASHRAAAAHYASALAFADELAPAARVELLDRHAYECYLTGQFAVAAESATAALSLWRALGDRSAEGRTLRFLSRQQWFLGDRGKAEHFAAEAIAVLSALPPGRDLAMAYSNRAQLEMLKGDLAGTLEFGRKAVALARTLADLEVECHALNNIGTAKLSDNDPSGTVELELSLKLARSQDLHEHVARAYVNLSTASGHQQRVASARGYLRDGLTYCEERDLDAWSRYLRASLARFEMDRGNWAEAEAAATRVIRDGEAPPVTRIPALVVLAQIRLRRGEPGADALMDEALVLALPTAEVQRIGPAASVRAEAAWMRGDPVNAVREADRGLAFAVAAKDAWRAGELLSWKSRAIAIADAPAWICLAHRLGVRGEWKAAADEFARHEMPYERALALVRGDRAAAAEGRRLLDQLGAKGTRAALERGTRA